jgi:hypothetical protein
VLVTLLVAVCDAVADIEDVAVGLGVCVAVALTEALMVLVPVLVTDGVPV